MKTKTAWMLGSATLALAVLSPIVGARGLGPYPYSFHVESTQAIGANLELDCPGGVEVWTAYVDGLETWSVCATLNAWDQASWDESGTTGGGANAIAYQEKGIIGYHDDYVTRAECHRSIREGSPSVSIGTIQWKATVGVLATPVTGCNWRPFATPIPFTGTRVCDAGTYWSTSLPAGQANFVPWLGEHTQRLDPLRAVYITGYAWDGATGSCVGFEF